MEFDKSRVYTSLNADELKVGSRVIAADSLNIIKAHVKSDEGIVTLTEVRDERHRCRFKCGDTPWSLAYLVSEPEKLKWTDLKIGDVITNDKQTAMITEIDTSDSERHIYAGHKWLANYELAEWEIVK